MSTAIAAPLPDLDGPLRTGLLSPHDAAVVVGVEEYAFIADVPHAKRDARAVRTHLVYARGIPMARVHTLARGANREMILGALDEAAEQASDGIVWVYFAGHGAASPTTGERLILGDDVRPDARSFEARAVTLTELRERAGPGAVILLDTCYSGRGRSGAELLPGTRFAVPDYAVTSDSDTLVWSAAGPNELSGPLDVAGHGAFTWFALGALRGWADGELDGQPDGVVTAQEAQLFVQRALPVAGIDQGPVLTGPDRVLGRAVEASPNLHGIDFVPRAPEPEPVALPTVSGHANRARRARRTLSR